MFCDPSPTVPPARVLLVRGGDLAAIRRLLATIGATVEVLVDEPPAVTQPVTQPVAQPMHVGPLVVDPVAHECWLAGRRVRCTATEFALLACLAERAGQVFTRRQLLECLRQSAEFVTERTVDTHVNNLRRKLGEAAAAPQLIETVYGVGYKLRALPRRLESVSAASSADSA